MDRIKRFITLLALFYLCGAFIAFEWDIRRWSIFNDEAGRAAFLVCIGSMIALSKDKIDF